MRAHSVHVDQSDTEEVRVLTHEEQEIQSSISTSSKTPLGRYSSTGPEYEPIQIVKTKGHGNQPKNNHHTQSGSQTILRPASYLIPIKSDSQTLSYTMV